MGRQRDVDNVCNAHTEQVLHQPEQLTCLRESSIVGDEGTGRAQGGHAIGQPYQRVSDARDMFDGEG